MVIDFHIHSKYSFDCFLEPSRIVKLCRLRGIDGIAVTDHDTMDGIPEFQELAPDLFIIAGEEISTRGGDILGLFLKEKIKPNSDPLQVVGEIRAQGGLAILAHPFKWPHLIRDEAFLSIFDALEVFNARNNISVPFLENAMASRAIKKFQLAYLAGSDTHEGFELGKAKTILDFSKEEADEAKIKAAILGRQLVIEGQEVWLPLEVISHFSRNFKSLFRR